MGLKTKDTQAICTDDYLWTPEVNLSSPNELLSNENDIFFSKSLQMKTSHVDLQFLAHGTSICLFIYLRMYELYLCMHVCMYMSMYITYTDFDFLDVAAKTQRLFFR